MTFQGRRCFALLERVMDVLPTLIYKLGMGLRFGRGDLLEDLSVSASLSAQETSMVYYAFLQDLLD